MDKHCMQRNEGKHFVNFRFLLNMKLIFSSAICKMHFKHHFVFFHNFAIIKHNSSFFCMPTGFFVLEQYYEGCCHMVLTKLTSNGMI